MAMTHPEPRRNGSLFGPVLNVMFKAGPLYRLAELVTAARFVVHGDSMLPAFAREHYILVSRLAWRRAAPTRGDVLVLRHPLRPDWHFIKRVVGLPGEEVRVKEGTVLIDGLPLEEPYLSDAVGVAHAAGTGSEPVSAEGEWTLLEGQYFVLGDNRTHSDDSRRFGPVDRESIIGKAWIRYWPPGTWGGLG